MTNPDTRPLTDIEKLFGDLDLLLNNYIEAGEGNNVDAIIHAFNSYHEQIGKIKGELTTLQSRRTVLEANRLHDQAEIARLREALSFYAYDKSNPNEGPWGIGSTDFGNVARAALEGEGS